MTVSQTSFASSTQTSAPAGRRERRRAEIRERLFRAALQVFAEKGFAETTCEDITNAADVGKGTFFNYFPTKDHILIALAEIQLGRLRAFVEEARRSSEPAPQVLAKVGEFVAADPVRTPEITRMLLLANLSTEPVRAALRVCQEQALLLLSQLIETGQQRGEVRTDYRAVDIAEAFRNLYFGALLRWSLRPDVPLKDHIDSSLQLLWNGIAASSDRDVPDRDVPSAERKRKG